MLRDEVVALAAGASIGIIADVILFPLDFLKTRQQGKTSASTHERRAVSRKVAAATRSAAPSPRTSTSAPSPAAPRHLPGAQARLEKPRGLRSCYKGIAALAMGSMPSSAGFFFVYEVAKERLKLLGKDPPPTRSSAVVSGAAGMAAGAVAAVVTTPMDVAKTRLMTQEPGARQYRGFYHCLHTMLRAEGGASLFLGVKMRCLWVALGGGIFLGGYDALKVWYLQLFERHSLFQNENCCGSCQLTSDSEPPVQVGSSTEPGSSGSAEQLTKQPRTPVPD
ncbi:hypothetical protein ACSSS7_003746 [Eimeria intestinalis]